MRAKILLTLLLLLTPLTRAAALAPPPADSLLYLSFKGSSHLGPAYDSSHLKSVLDASQFNKSYHQLNLQLYKLADRNDPGSSRAIRHLFSFLQILSRQGFSLYILPAPPRDRINPFLIGISCDAGPESDAIESFLRSLAQEIHQGISFHRTSTTFSITFSLLHSIPSTSAPSVTPALTSPSPAFQSALHHVGSDPVFLFYVDFEHILLQLDYSLAADAPTWTQIKSLTAISNLKRYILTGAFTADGNWSTQSFTEAPAPRTGWLALVRSESLPASLLPYIPADSTYVRVGHFDPVGWIDSFRHIALATGPAGQQKFDQILGIANLYIGRNLTTDILAPLGTDWAIYSSPRQATAQLPDPSPIPNFILLCKVTDEPKASAGLTALTYALANTAQMPQVRALGITASASQSTLSDLTITSLKLTLPNPRFASLCPSWTIKDSHLFLGLSPESVAAAATYSGKPFTDSPAFVAAKKLLASPTSESSFEFTDLSPDSYQNFRDLLDTGLNFLNSKGLAVTTNPLPASNAIAPYLHPVLRLSWSDANGFHSQSISPFPGASLLTPGGLSSIGCTALGVSVALPTLNRYQEIANRVKCASNMKVIGLCIGKYAHEHNGHFPPDLGTIVITQEIGPDLFTCPSSNTKPITYTGLSLAPEQFAPQLRDRVTADTDYIYLGKSFTNPIDPNSLILYEKFENHFNGINMLFADGSVEFLIRPIAEHILAAGKRSSK